MMKVAAGDRDVTGKSQFFGDEKPWPIGRRNSGVRGELGLAQNGRISLPFREEGEGRLLRHSPAQTCRIIPEYRTKNPDSTGFLRKCRSRLFSYGGGCRLRLHERFSLNFS